MNSTYRYEGGDLLSVLNQLHTDTFSDGRVGLFCFNTDFLKYDAFGMRRASSWGGFEGVT
jgi:hypothetical protein